MKRIFLWTALLSACLAMSLMGLGASAEELSPQAAGLPAAESLAQTAEASASSDAWPDALEFALTGDGSASLSMTAIRARFGDDATIYAAEPSQTYVPLAEDANGIVALPADGVERSVVIANVGGNLLWAGTFSGRADDAPRTTIRCAQDEEGNLSLTLPSRIDMLALSFLQADPGGTYAHIALQKSEFVIDCAPGQTKYLLIARPGQADRGGCLWAGAITLPAEQQAPLRLVPSWSAPQSEVPAAEEPAPQSEAPVGEGDWQFEIVRFDTDISLRFSDAIVRAPRDGLLLEYVFLDPAGSQIDFTQESAPEISGLGTYTAFANQAVPDGAAAVQINLWYNGAFLFSQTAPRGTGTPSIGDEAESAPVEEVLPATDEVPPADRTIPAVDEALPTTGEVLPADETVPTVNEAVPAEAPVAEGEAIPLLPPESTTIPEPTATPEPAPTPEPTATPQPVLTVRVSGYDGPYDGQPHSVDVAEQNPLSLEINPDAAQEPPSDAELTYFYACVAEGALPAEGDWLPGPCTSTNAGTVDVCVRVEKDGYAVEYCDADGQPLPAEDGFVRTAIRIDPVPVRVRVRAEGVGETTYTGAEQDLPFVYRVEEIEDPSGLFDPSAISADALWSAQESVRAVDAGDYPVALTDERRAMLVDFYPNFDLEIDWQESSVRIQKKPVVLESASTVGLYGVSGAPLQASGVAGTEQIAPSDRSDGDISAQGALSEVGRCANAIQIAGRFSARQDNYDLEIREGTLVLLPQSIDASDPSWAEAQDEIDVDELPPDALPAYSLGMSVSLDRDEFQYDGAAKAIDVVFKDRSGFVLPLEEGRDYSVAFYRDGALTDDLTTAGTIAVRVTGMGNYAGQVERTCVINRVEVSDTDVVAGGWVYDGEPAGSAAHPFGVEEGAELIYRNERGEEIDAPCDVGNYTVQAIWPQDDNREGAQSEPSPFSITPVAVTVTIQDGEVIDVQENSRISDESKRFREDMIELRDGAYVCTNANFKVTFNVMQVYLESWTFDGMPANSDAHPIHAAHSLAAPAYHFYNADGAEIDAPRDVGTYKLVSVWPETANLPEETVEQEFTIDPAPVTVRADDLEKVYGEADPPLTQSVEGLLEGDSIEWTLSRAEGEDAGDYAIAIDGEARQGNYAITWVPGTLSITPRSIDGAEMEMSGKDPILLLDGGALEEGRDYAVSIEESPEHSRQYAATFTGSGNYSGTYSATYTVSPLRLLLSKECTPWFLLAVGCAVGAVACLLICLRLTKRLRKERFKLLDKVTRQSSRTIRQNRDGD